MSEKRVRDDVRESSGDDDSEVEDVTEVPKRFSRRMTASFRGTSFLREEQFQAEMKDSMYFFSMYWAWLCCFYF